MNVFLISLLFLPVQDSDPLKPIPSTRNPISQKQGQLEPAIPKATLDEIQQIRKRMGIKLFDDSNNRKFAQQLQKVHQAAKPTTPLFSPHRKPLVEPVPGRTQVATAVSNRRPRVSAQVEMTRRSLFDSIDQLDRLALELEKQGEFAKSKNMRKLSRKIRKQLQELSNSRDN